MIIVYIIRDLISLNTQFLYKIRNGRLFSSFFIAGVRNISPLPGRIPTGGLHQNPQLVLDSSCLEDL